MKPSDAPIDGKVILHRWFAGGEGWAYHPALRPYFRELIDVLTPVLQSRSAMGSSQPERSTREWSGGWLVVSHRRDSQCPDPKARDRNPTILRALVLNDEPRDRDFLAVLCGPLEAMESDVAGEDTRMELRCVLDSGRPNRDPRRTRSPLARVFVMCAAIVVGCAAGAYFWWSTLAGNGTGSQPGSTTGQFGEGADRQPPGEINGGGAANDNGTNYEEKSYREVDAAVGKARSMLDEWRVGDRSWASVEDSDEIIERLLRFLSQTEIGFGASPWDESRHPDVSFLDRLPPKPSPVRDDRGPSKVKTAVPMLYVALHNLAEGVRLSGDTRFAELPVPRPPSPSKTLKEHLPTLLEIIEGGMDYRKWFAAHYPDPFPFDSASPAEVRDYVGHFLPNGSAQSAAEDEAVKKAYQLLEKWKVPSVEERDVRERPWLIRLCFLEFLSTDRFQSVLNEQCLYCAFVRRLPKCRDFARRSAPDEFTADDLADSISIEDLKSLRGALRAGSGVTSQTVLGNIGDRLVYETWKQELSAKATAALEQAKKDVTERFRKKRDPDQPSAEYRPELATYAPDVPEMTVYGKVTIKVDWLEESRQATAEDVQLPPIAEASRSEAINTFVERFTSELRGPTRADGRGK